MPIQFLINCKLCKKKVYGYLRKDRVREFCSVSCKASFCGKGRKPTAEARRNMSIARIGVVPWNKGKKGFFKHTKKWKKEASKRMKGNKYCFGKPSWKKGKPFLQMRGKNNPSWKGGITSKDQTERCRVEFKLWREAVFKKNKKICKICGSRKMLIAHHIKFFKDYPKLRYEVKNGMIVCRRCHPPLHKKKKQNGI